MQQHTPRTLKNAMDIPMLTWTHRHRLNDHAIHRLDLGGDSALPAGGSGWLDDTGAIQPQHPVQTWITARKTHVHGVAMRLGTTVARSRPHRVVAEAISAAAALSRVK